MLCRSKFLTCLTSTHYQFFQTMSKIFSVENYSNLLKSISLTSDDIRNQIEGYKLPFPQERNNEVEWGIKLPMFVDSFYAYIVENQTIPTQKEAFDYYLHYNKDFFIELNRPDLESGIMARAFRTYPSLVRDIHFNKYIEERLGRKCQIIFNTRLDIEEGIDLMIVTKKNNYGVCFFTDTDRANKARIVKKKRHTPFDNVKYVEMPVNFKGSMKVGKYYLYGEKEYKELYNTLSK